MINKNQNDAQIKRKLKLRQNYAKPMIDEFINIIKNKTELSKENCEKIKASFVKDRSNITASAVETKLVAENEVLEALDRIYSLPFVANLSMENVKNDLTALISRQFLKRFGEEPSILKFILSDRILPRPFHSVWPQALEIQWKEFPV